MLPQAPQADGPAPCVEEAAEPPPCVEEAEADSEPLAEPELARGTEKHSNSKQRRMRRQRAASRLCQGHHTIGPPPLPGRDALYRIAMEKRLELWRSLPLEAAERKELAAEIALGQPGPAQEPSAPVLLALPARRDIFLAGSGLVLVGCGPGGLRGQALAAAHQPPPWQFRGAAGHSHGHAGCGAALGRSALVPEISAGAGCCRGSGSVPTCPSWPGRNWLANWPPRRACQSCCATSTAILWSQAPSCTRQVMRSGHGGWTARCHRSR